MADANSMSVGTSSAHLIGVELHENVWYRLFHLVVVFHDPVDGVGAILHDNIEVGLPRFVPRGVKCMFEFHHIWVSELFHDLQLPVLVPLVLEHLFDRNTFACLHHLCLVNNTKRSTAKD